MNKFKTWLSGLLLSWSNALGQPNVIKPTPKNEEREDLWRRFGFNVFLVFIIAVCILGVWLIFRILQPIHAPISDTNLTIVLSFLGVLATFIVVGNFSQVTAIKDEMSNKIENLREQSKKYINTSFFEKQQNNIKKLNITSERQLLELALLLVQTNQVDLFLDVINNQQKPHVIWHDNVSDENKVENVMARINNKVIEFYTNEQIITNVVKVDEISFSAAVINSAIQFYQKELPAETVTSPLENDNYEDLDN